MSKIYFVKKNKLLFITPFLFFTLISFAQSITPSPGSTAKWTMGIYNVYGHFYSNYTYQIPSTNQDTTIGNIVYKKIIYSDSTNTPIYKGALRQANNRKVFFVPKDSTTEKLLYDFSANIGDTVKNVYSEWNVTEPVHNEVILDVDSVLIYGVYHKRMLIPLNFYWIEGIGSNGGLLESTYGGTFSVVYKLDCFSIDSTLRYSNGSPACTPASVMNLKNEIELASIFPNPNNGEMQLQLNFATPQELFFKLYNATGECIYQKKFHEITASIAIDKTDLPNGIYFYELNNNSVIKRDKIVIAK